MSKPQPTVPVQRVSPQAAGEDAEPDLPSMSAEGFSAISICFDIFALLDLCTQEKMHNRKEKG